MDLIKRQGAIETLKENLCGMCAYDSQNMESCDIRGCDNRDAIKAIERDLSKRKECEEREQGLCPFYAG